MCVQKKLFYRPLPFLLIISLIFGAYLFVIKTTKAAGTIYYVDNCDVIGNDSNNGTSASTPWLTINKINTSSFVAGDSILFRKGCTWREQLTVPSSGDTTGNITFGSYGDLGSNPIILGTDNKSGTGNWTNEVSAPGTEESCAENCVFASGIEDETGTFTTDFSGRTLGAGNAATIATTAGTYNSGIKGGKSTFGGTTANAYVYKNFADQTTAYARAYIKLNSNFALTGNYQTIGLLGLKDNTNNKILVTASIQCSTSPYNSCKWVATAANPSATIYNSGPYGEVSLNTWYRVEMKFVQGTGTNGQAQVWIDGVSKGTPATAQTWSTLTADTVTVSSGSGGSSGVPNSVAEIYFDDVKVDTSAIGAVSLPSGDPNYYYATGYTSDPGSIYINDSRLTRVSGKSSLDTTGEWWYDSINQRVYLWSNSANPGTNKIEIGSITRNKGIYIPSKSYITIENLNIKRITGAAIKLYAGGGNFSNITIWNNTLSSEDINGSAGVYISSGNGYYWSNLLINSNAITPFPANFSNQTAGRMRYGIYTGNNALGKIINSTISNNVISSAGEDGIVGDYWDTVTVSGNTEGGNGENSLDIKNSRNITVTGNTFNNDYGANILFHEDTADVHPDDSCYNNIIENNRLTQSGQGAESPRVGIWMHYCDDSKIRYNSVSTAFGSGIYLQDDESSANNNEIDYNVVFNNGTGATGGGIAVQNGVGTKIYNNTIYNQGTSGNGIWVLGNTNTTSINIKNNIIHTAGGDLIRVASGATTGLVSDYNIFYPDGTGQFTWNGTASDNFADWKVDSNLDTHSISSNPLFADAGSGNFTLTATSPAIDAGTNLGSDYDDGLSPSSLWPSSVTTIDQDLLGSGWDIGAYEFAVGSSPLPTTFPTSTITPTPTANPISSITPTPTTIPTPISGGGSGGGGGGGGAISRTPTPLPTGGSTPTPTPCAPPTTSGITLTRNLYMGVSKGEDIRTLQTYLKNLGYFPQTQNTTTSFGPITREAVRKFQCAKLNICSGTEGTNGYGAVGPKTRKALLGGGGSIGSTSSLQACAIPPSQGATAGAVGKFIIGNRIKVSASIINVRITPNGPVTGKVTQNTQGIIKKGPVNYYGYIWYQITYDNGTVGWSAEASGTTQLLVGM